MNYAELDPYIEEFDSVILQRNPRLTDAQVEKEREKSFPTWLRSRRYGTWRTESEGFHLRRPRVRLPVYAGRPGDIDCLPIHASRPDDRDCLPVHAGCPGDMDRLPDHANSATFPFFLTTRGKIDPGSASRYITTLVHAHIPGPVDAWREFPMPIQDLLFDMFMETYDRTMADCYAEGTPQPDLDPEAWVDVAGGPRKGRVYGFGDCLDTTPVLSSYASSVAPPAYASSSAAPPGRGVEEMRTLIREELRTHFGVMVE
ncbi:hypothetical protein Taro_009385 [Colocasia esculenta]|uniref:Uncharacterized protein n=1 Tax=Colocasia esculenta TaxID=4460 RepID=A0A843U4T5_COLES|nr:hypothetical protein [Colocasia esculenta]